MSNNATRIFKFFSWNVRGLNDRNKRSLVKEVINKVAPNLVCLQETKWAVENAAYVRQTLGHKLNEYEVLLAEGTAGGLIIAWYSGSLTKIDKKQGKYYLTIDFMINLDSSVLSFTGVYGPSTQSDKPLFFRELKQHKPTWICLRWRQVTLM